MGRVKSIPCPHCQKMFSRKGHMTEHVRTVHEGKKRIYKEVNCQHCGKTFRRKWGLNIHIFSSRRCGFPPRTTMISKKNTRVVHDWAMRPRSPLWPPYYNISRITPYWCYQILCCSNTVKVSKYLKNTL